METFSASLAICAGNSPVPGEFPHKGQWRGALMFSLICVWINGWVNNRKAGDLRRYRIHYDVIVMQQQLPDNCVPGRGRYICLMITCFIFSSCIIISFKWWNINTHKYEMPNLFIIYGRDCVTCNELITTLWGKGWIIYEQKTRQRPVIMKFWSAFQISFEK